MLLNLSNHPSTHWSKVQIQKATDQYDSIEDMPFPNIPPTASSKEVAEMVHLFYDKITAMLPLLKAVHLQGEMTFSHALINRLINKEIKVIASTTERRVEERNGKKIVQFEFVQFRSYF